jgi:uncharacterized oligopeptide transporter (OPT) family protein
MLMSAFRIIGLQAGIVVVSALLAAWVLDVPAALALAYGGAVATANVALLFWRWWQGKDVFHCDTQRHVRTFFRSSLERFFVVGILLAVGFLLLKLKPIALVAGFVVGQLAWMFASLALRERT